MKKYLSKLLILMMIFAVMPVNTVFAATDKAELEIINIVSPSEELFEGDATLVGMTLKNNTDGIMKDVKVTISGGFYTVNETAEREVDNVNPKNEMIISPFRLRYDGGKNTKIIVKISYKLGSANTVTDKIVYIPTNAQPGKEGTGTPSNTELYKPVLAIGKGEQPVVTGEEVETIKINIVNDSIFNAKEVKITGEFGVSKFELAEISATKQKNELNAGDGFDVEYKIRGKKDVAKGIYPVKLNYKFSNEYGNETTGSFEIYVKYIPEEVDTDVELISDEEYQKIIAGEDFKLDLTVKNSSKDEIKDLKVELLDLKSENVINKYSNYKKVDKLEAGKETKVSIDMISNETTATGNYAIKAKLTFKDRLGNEKQITRTFFRKVEKTETEIFVGGLTSSKSIVKEGDEFTVTVPVYNYGEKKAENLRVMAEGATGVMNISSNVTLVKEIEAGSNKELVFKFKVAPKAAEGNKLITVKVIEGKTEKSSTLNVYTEVESENDNKSVPKIIISKYSSNPVMVKAGKNFELDMSFMNSHSDKTVKNIKITLQARETSDKTGSVFSPVNSSNTFFIDEINPKTEANKIMTMYTIPDAKSKTYIMDVKMEYEDAEGNAYSTTDQIGLPVRQISKFMTSDIKVPTNSEMNRGIRLDIDISNTGKIDLSNFTVKVEGDFMASNTSTYVGTITPGDREYYDVDLTPTKEGVNNGAFVFTYEESSGDVVEVRKEFSSNAQAPYVPEINPENMNNNMNNGNNPIDTAPKGFPTGKVLLGVGVLAVIILIIVLRKRAKKKKEMELDE